MIKKKYTFKLTETWALIYKTLKIYTKHTR